MNTYHLAQVNIAAMRTPIDDPVMADFVNNLDRINAIAENATGFVWRLAGDDNNATALRVFDNQMIIINMSVWESIDALHNYTYYSDHAEIFRRRSEWFEKLDKPHMVLWWIPAGHIPTPQEAKDKLAYIEQYGVTPLAFMFKQRHTAEEMLALVGSE
jgi:hypothetical protein